MKMKNLITTSIALCLILFALTTPAIGEATLAGGNKKTYGGVFVEGGYLAEDPPKIFEKNILAYTQRLHDAPNQGISKWEMRMMTKLGANLGSPDNVQKAINRFKPGGDPNLTLKDGDEFQFVFVGHGGDGYGFYDFMLQDTDGYNVHCTAKHLAKWLSGFPKSVTISVILHSCCSAQGAEELREEGVRNDKGHRLDPNHLSVVGSADCNDAVTDPVFWGKNLYFLEVLTKGIENDLKQSGIAITKDVITNHVDPNLRTNQLGDSDGDGEIDEDGCSFCGVTGKDKIGYDDDGDDQIDEDPPPQEFYYGEGSLTPVCAYNLIPWYRQSDIPPNIVLQWSPGDHAQYHDIYFGTSYAEVNEANNSDPMGDAEIYRARQSIGDETYAIPETLDIGQTYFWRIDEVNDACAPYLWRGDVWSFETQCRAKNPYPPDDAVGVERQVELSWRPGFPGAEHDMYFGTNVEEVTNMEADDPDPNYIYRGRQVPEVNSYSIPETLRLDTAFYWRIDEVNEPCSLFFKGDVWQFTTISGKAKAPYPADEAEGIYVHAIKLIWTPGPYAASHDVYFGTNYNDVAGANDDDPTGIFRGNQIETEYDLSNLDLETTYYWRIDEVNLAHPDQNWPGYIWSFTIPDYITIDDFEYYTISDPEGHDECPYYDGNDLRTDLNNDMRFWWLDGHVWKNPQGDCGSAMEDYNPLILECSMGKLPGSRIIRTYYGQLGYSMSYYYDNDDVNNADFPPEEFATEDHYSEILRYYIGNGLDLTPDDKINADFRAIEFNYKGQPGNDCDPVYDRMYVGLKDTSGNYAYVDNPDPNAAKNTTWQQWAIELSDFTDENPDLDLNHIRSVRIGFGLRGNRYNDPEGGEGTVIFDDIRVFEQRCVPAYGPVGDFSGEEGVQDCVVDFRDLSVMADEWLESYGIQTDLYYSDPTIIDFRDYAVLAENWLEEQLWPSE